MHRYEPKAYSICEVKAECFTVWIIAKVRLVKIKISIEHVYVRQ